MSANTKSKTSGDGSAVTSLGTSRPTALPPIASSRVSTADGNNASQPLISSLPSPKLSTAALPAARGATTTTAKACMPATLPLVPSSLQPGTLCSPANAGGKPTLPLAVLSASTACETVLNRCPDINLGALIDAEQVDAVGANAIMNGYEVPDFVKSAGGLQSLSFLVEHRADIAADTSTLNLAKFTLFTPAAWSDADAASRDQEKQKQGAEKEPTCVSAPIPSEVAARFKRGGQADAEDEWCDVISPVHLDEKDADSTKTPKADTEAARAEDDEHSTELPSGARTPLSQTDSILLPSALHRSRSLDRNLNNFQPFHKRTVLVREAFADLECFRAYEYILFFFEAHGYQIDENLSGGSSLSGQMSRRNSRKRIAVAHGVDFGEHLPRRLPTVEERKVAFASNNMAELMANLSRTYRRAGITKAYLDVTYITEVQQGTRKLRPQDARHPGLKEDPVSPPSSDEDNNEAIARLRSTEVVLSNDEIETALRLVFVSDGSMREVPDSGASRAKACATSVSQNNKLEDKQLEKCKKVSNNGRQHALRTPIVTPTATTTTTATSKETASKPGEQLLRGNKSDVILKLLWLRTSRYYYQHNAMTLRTQRGVRKAGNVTINGRTFRMHLWDSLKYGYLVTGVFDRTPGYPKNFKDSFTKELYAEELSGSGATVFPKPLMTRQHNALNARRVTAEDGVTLRGCSVVQHSDVFSIFDGRVQGCQIARNVRDYRRTAMHAAIQSLAHYRNLFPKMKSLLNILHPQDRYQCPVLNPVGGMYCIPLIINGATRLVKVDDYVPMDPTTGVFRCLTSKINELFPTLLEKALLKANGGGVTVALMDSCTVMHQLCGWIPRPIRFFVTRFGKEQLSDFMLRPSELWDDIASLYRRGCMVMSVLGVWRSGEAKKTLTYPDYHSYSWTEEFCSPVSYPVVDIISRVDDRAGIPIRAVMMRDMTWDPSDKNFEPPIQTSLSEALLFSIGYTDFHRHNGVFCLSWEEVVTYFTSCCISLNPCMLWKEDVPKGMPRIVTRVCCHGVYDASKVGMELFYQAQFHIRCTNVKTSTQVHVAYASHTSLQYPLPWPCDGLSSMTVDRCSNGGTKVQLRVYEITGLPSLLQVEREGEGGRAAQTCTLDRCVARRVTCENEQPWQRRDLLTADRNKSREQRSVWHDGCLANVVAYANNMTSIAFDVSPGTRDYVVVLKMCPRVFAEGNGPWKDFPYTLTAYSNMTALEPANPTCVPCVPGQASECVEEEKEDEAEDEKGKTRAVTTEGKKGSDSRTSKQKSRLTQLMENDEGKSKLGAPTITMHAIPPSLDVNSRTVQGMWVAEDMQHRVLLLEEGLRTETVWTGPQYHLHLHRPDDFCIRITPLRVNCAIDKARVPRLLLVRKNVRKTEALEGSVLEQCDLVLTSRIFDTQGAELSSTSPHSVLLDRKADMVRDPLRVRQEYHAMIHVIAIVDPVYNVKDTRSLLIRYPNPSETVRWLMVRAFAEGLFLSPQACRVSYMGVTVSPDTKLRKLFADTRGTYTFDGKTGNWQPLMKGNGQRALDVDELNLGIYYDIEMENLSPFTESHFPENEMSGVFVARMRDIAMASLMAGSEQRTRTLRATSFFKEQIEQSTLPPDKIHFLVGIALGIADWCCISACRVAEVKSTPRLMPSMLPAGDYIIVTGFYPYTLGSETNGLPGQIGFKDYKEPVLHFDLKVELLRQHVELTAISGTKVPKFSEDGPQSAKLDEFSLPK